MKAEEIIKRYDNLKKEQHMLEIQISSFKGITDRDIIETMSYSHPSGEKVVTSGLPDKTAKIAVNYSKKKNQENDEMYEFLIKHYSMVTEEIDFFESTISRMKYKTVAEALFIQKLTWIEIENLFNISHATIGRYRREIIKELEVIYNLRSKQLEAFLLS